MVSYREKAYTKTPFTRYRICLNPVCFQTVLAFNLHEDDDEYGMISRRL